MRPTFLLDLKNIRTGWLRFREGQAPERVIDPSLDRAAPSSADDFKRGFIVTAFSPKFFGGAVEFSSASIHLSNVIRELYAAFEVQGTAGRRLDDAWHRPNASAKPRLPSLESLPSFCTECGSKAPNLNGVPSRFVWSAAPQRRSPEPGAPSSAPPRRAYMTPRICCGRCHIPGPPLHLNGTSPSKCWAAAGRRAQSQSPCRVRAALDRCQPGRRVQGRPEGPTWSARLAGSARGSQRCCRDRCCE